MFSPQSPCSAWVAGVVLSARGQSCLLQREETSSFPHPAAVVGRLGAELGSSHTTSGRAELRTKAGAAWGAAPMWELADRRGQDFGWRGSLQPLLAVLGLKMSQAEGHGDSSGSPQVQLLVKSKSSEIKREFLGRFCTVCRTRDLGKFCVPRCGCQDSHDTQSALIKTSEGKKADGIKKYYSSVLARRNS